MLLLTMIIKLGPTMTLHNTSTYSTVPLELFLVELGVMVAREIICHSIVKKKIITYITYHVVVYVMNF